MDNSSPIYTEFLPISRADMEARGGDQLELCGGGRRCLR